jgi:hypothetical protein
MRTEVGGRWYRSTQGQTAGLLIFFGNFNWTPSREELKTVFSIFTTFDAASASGVSQLSKRFTVAAVMISKPLEDLKTAVMPSALEEL